MTSEAMKRVLDEQDMFADLHIGDAAASAFVKAESAKWAPVVANLGDLIRR